MDRLQRLHIIDSLLHRGSPSLSRLQEALEVSRATVVRDIAYIRDVQRKPIAYDRERGGYCWAAPQPGVKQIELPEMWFSDQEIYALLTMQHLIANLDPSGILKRHIEPLMERLNKLLGAAHNEADEVRRRVLIAGLGKRSIKQKHFELIGHALLKRRRLQMQYQGRGSGVISEREVSPQRLVHYRENWYLEAWCHLRSELRTFSLDAIEQVEMLAQPAHEITIKQLNQKFGLGYGVFSGSKLQWATLRFTAERARWVAKEFWHLKQKGKFERSGCYVLKVPYADHRELMMDILKHGAHCEVVGPASLRNYVKVELSLLLKKY